MGLDRYNNSSGRKVEQKLLRKILKVVADKKATYASEVSHFVDADPSEVASILRQLEESDVLEVLKPKMKHSDPRLLSASKRTGKRSIDQMRQPTWYGLNSDVDWALKDKKRGYIDPYGNSVESPEIRKNLMDYAVDRMDQEGKM